jgi:hypothetical protein
VSWLAAIYALWHAMRRPGQTVLVISRRQDDADKFLEKVAFVYERLPAWRPIASSTPDSISFPGLKRDRGAAGDRERRPVADRDSS